MKRENQTKSSLPSTTDFVFPVGVAGISNEHARLCGKLCQDAHKEADEYYRNLEIDV